MKLTVRLAFILAGCSAARAEIVVVANDNKMMIERGVQRVKPEFEPDTLSIVEIAGGSGRLVAEIEGVPASVVGPPASVAVTPDERMALVLATNRVDPANPRRQVPDNRMSVIDLAAHPPRVIATVETGRAPSGVSINPAGTLAVVGNRSDGTLSVFRIQGATLTPLQTVALATPAAGVRHPVFTPDGRRVLVTRDGDHAISVVDVEGETLKPTGHVIRSGLKPYVIDVARNGRVAVVGNVGFLNGDTDTIGVIDLQVNPPRAVDLIPVGQTPEAVRLSPDGSLCAVVLTNGSSKAEDFPFYSHEGRLLLFRVDGLKLTQVAEAPLGGWPQTAVISADNRTILASSMLERCLYVFRWDGKTLQPQPRIELSGAPAAMGIAVK